MLYTLFLRSSFASQMSTIIARHTSKSAYKVSVPNRVFNERDFEQNSAESIPDTMPDVAHMYIIAS